jgi:mercuric ion binding protein
VGLSDIVDRNRSSHFISNKKPLKTISMKSAKIMFSVLLAFVAIATAGAQKSTITESFKVLGNCGMCQKTIQTAALGAGATSAVWNVETHMLSVTFKKKKTNVEAIQKAVAGKGYDTPLHRASDAVYNNLHGCCKYDRTESLQ